MRRARRRGDSYSTPPRVAAAYHDVVGLQGRLQLRHDVGDVATPPVPAKPFQARQLCVFEHTLRHRTV